jgi:uncharacterized protein YndB with AHSA1/START domain
VTSPDSTRPVLVKESIRVELDPDRAFILFTSGIDEWWPLDEGFSFGGDKASSIHLEPWPDGRLYEQWVDGDRFETGRVTECEPPDRLVFTWRDAEDRGTMEVEVRFAPQHEGTLVTVEHRGFERLGPSGTDLAARYAGGWPRVLERYARRAEIE